MRATKAIEKELASVKNIPVMKMLSSLKYAC
jgi:hypothetical protein